MNMSEVELYQESGVDEKFYDDLIIVKGKTKVHFKSMSAGEKKIATLIRELCKLKHEKKHIDIALIDNIEMHVYMKRHAKLIDKIKEHFGDKQIICTTHSPVLVGTDEIKGYLDEECLYDIEKYKE
jgi:predicted ATPase